MTISAIRNPVHQDGGFVTGIGGGSEPATWPVTWSIDTRPLGGVGGGAKTSSPELTRVSSGVRVVGEGPRRRRGRVSRRNVGESIRSGTRLARTVARMVVGLASSLECSGAVTVTRVGGRTGPYRTRWICCSVARASWAWRSVWFALRIPSTCCQADAMSWVLLLWTTSVPIPAADRLRGSRFSSFTHPGAVRSTDCTAASQRP